MKFQTFACLVAGVLFGSGVASAGTVFTITPTFDSTIMNDPNSAAIEGVINSAIATFEATFSNPINVLIYFQEGGGLGQSNTVSYFNTYASFHTDLVATNANPAAIAALNANGGNGANSPVSGSMGNADLLVKSADGRAVGLTGDVAACNVTAVTPTKANGMIPNDCSGSTGPLVDAIVSLNTAITNPGSPGAVGNYPLLSTTEHEIDEVLGLGSSLNNCDDTQVTPPPNCSVGTAYNSTGQYAAPEDLFRYDSAGNRTLSTTCSSMAVGAPSAFFSYGPATGQIAQFNNDCNGGDFGDWQSSPRPMGTPAQVQDAFTGPGAGPSLGASEIAALSAIGYTLAAPEPGTMVLFGAGLVAFGFYRRRRN